MDDLKAKLDALSAKATRGSWWNEGPDYFGDYNICKEGETLAIGAVVSNMRKPAEIAANAALIVELINAYRTGQLIVAPVWQPIETAPKDGTHILVSVGRFGPHWTFAQCPPRVVHWWPHPGEEGFYLSSGGAETDEPIVASAWMPLPTPPAGE